MVVPWAQSYLCESVLVQKTLVELQGFLGVCSQCASINGRIGEASQRCSEGWRVGLGLSCELLPRGRSIATSPDLVVPERFNTDILSGFPGVWRCHWETMAFLPDR